MSCKCRILVRKRMEDVYALAVAVSLLVLFRNFNDNPIHYLHFSQECLVENGDSSLNVQVLKESKETLKFLDTDKGLLRQSVFPSGSRMPPLLLIVIVNGRVKRLFFGGGKRERYPFTPKVTNEHSWLLHKLRTRRQILIKNIYRLGRAAASFSYGSRMHSAAGHRSPIPISLTNRQ